MLIWVRIFIFGVGLLITIRTLLSAIRTFVLPRGTPDYISRNIFLSNRWIFMNLARRHRDVLRRDGVMSFFAPVSLLALLPAWLTLIWIGYALMFWAVDQPGWYEAFHLSGSSLLTLGFAETEGVPAMLLEFSEATLGLILVALLIAYLPTMYSAFSHREAAVTLLEGRAGSPPSAAEMLARYYRNHGLESLGVQWRMWETWFAEVQESHTSLPALAFFRSPNPKHSWVTSAGAVLDTAALTLSAVEIPYDVNAALCIRAGFLALRSVADYFNIEHDPDPKPDDPISIRREEFVQVLDRLEKAGLPLKADRQQAWIDFSGWRVNYDTVLLALAGLTMAPEAPWSADRTPEALHMPPIWRSKRG